MNGARDYDSGHRTAADVQRKRRRHADYLMCRHAQRAVVVRLPGGVEMRRLDHSARQHQQDADDAQNQDPTQARIGQDAAHVTVSTIAGVGG